MTSEGGWVYRIVTGVASDVGMLVYYVFSNDSWALECQCEFDSLKFNFVTVT